MPSSVNGGTESAYLISNVVGVLEWQKCNEKS